jgi:molecular chaperone HtpG
MLQHNVVVRRIRTALVRRVFNELKKRAEKAPEEYSAFWDNFGPVLKEGLYEDHENREKLLELVRFRSTGSGDITSLAAYNERMKKGQEDIFYISGENLDALQASPQLEGFRAKGVEVLLMTDPVDEFWLPMVGEFDGKKFTSVTSGSIDLSKIKQTGKNKKANVEKEAEKAGDADIAKLVLAFKETLGDTVKDVHPSERLTDSAVCLVAGEGDMDLHLERMLKMQGHLDVPSASRVMEINPAHPLIKKLSELVNKPAKKKSVEEMAYILLDQARIVEGEPVIDPAAFSKRLNSILEGSL